GSTWTNLTTTVLNGEAPRSIVLVAGADNGIYYCTNWSVYYRDDNMADWVSYASDLPIQFNTNIARPFYRDGKLRIASYGKGIWEADFRDPPSRPIAQAMVHALEAICAGDTFQFEDYSMLRHAGATWAWTFQNGTPATSNLRNPKVVFTGQGTHEVTLTVTNAGGQSSSDTLSITLTGTTNTNLAEGFENNFPPDDWTTFSTGPLSWVQNPNYGGWAGSPSSASCDNFNVDGQGSYADMRAFLNMTTVQPGLLTFDVAYAPYGGIYSDSLEVLVSTDCGSTYTSHYFKGGQTLATAANITSGPFLPAFSQWRKDSIDLSMYSGFAEVVVAFRNWGYWGQVMYLDNINLDGNPIIGLETGPGSAYAQLAPNPVVAGGEVVLRSSLDEAFRVTLYDLNGKQVMQKMLRNGESMQPALASGTYFYTLKGETLLERGKLILVGSR
ncbi:MAG: PKD domain-containing protein, partial [Bacteroidota bacterium]